MPLLPRPPIIDVSRSALVPLPAEDAADWPDVEVGHPIPLFETDGVAVRVTLVDGDKPQQFIRVFKNAHQLSDAEVTQKTRKDFENGTRQTSTYAD